MLRVRGYKFQKPATPNKKNLTHVNQPQSHSLHRHEPRWFYS